MAECTAMNEFAQGKSSAGSSTLGKRPFDLEKESNPALKPMIAENAARIATLNIDDKKVVGSMENFSCRHPSEIEYGKLMIRRIFSKDRTPAVREVRLRPFERKLSDPLHFAKFIIGLDGWNSSSWEMIQAEIAAFPDLPEAKRARHVLDNLPCLDAEHLRAIRPDYIPVSVEKDARSDLPQIRLKLYHVPGAVTLEEFIDYIWRNIHPHPRKPLWVFYGETQFPKDALMSAIYQENVGEDGYLHMTYSGEEHGDVLGSVE